MYIYKMDIGDKLWDDNDCIDPRWIYVKRCLFFL